ncbi:GNAT family N-acetyltransferase [Rhodoligotrophos ferricapiens]|uniref:GNAT family N-acetyltransferase n=1 Tax=Rhodoligotrophos ferricapiens TaxID=3069264 RepID=UPI00315C685F
MRAALQITRLETRALTLREIRARDARAFAAYMLRNDYQKHVAVRYASAADVQGFVARSLRRQMSPNRTLYHLAAELKATGHVIGDGFIQLNRPQSAEIGWGVHPELWRRGFATEIGQALVAIGFERLGCSRMWAKAFAENEASIRIMEKIGMRRERFAQDQYVGNGLRTDLYIYSMTADDYFDAAY